MSGGVDSLCALLLLRSQGHEVIAIHALLAQPPCQGLGSICASLHVPLYVLDLRKMFRLQVVEPFIEAQARLLTPNPCIICNKTIKFGALLEAARRLGCHALATGHYCRMDTASGLPGRGLDAKKDQSYFLSAVACATLPWLEFPLGGLEKQHCRKIVERAGIIVPESRESQDICFMAGMDKGKFLQARQPDLGTPGPIVLRHDGRLQVIGEHCGLGHYTVGQRKGLGVPWDRPLYVRERQASNNMLIVAPREQLYIAGCRAGRLNFFLPHALWPEEVFATLRYRQPQAPCKVDHQGQSMIITFETPQFGTAPGQQAVIYDNSGRMLASGVIEQLIFRD